MPVSRVDKHDSPHDRIATKEETESGLGEPDIHGSVEQGSQLFGVHGQVNI